MGTLQNLEQVLARKQAILDGDAASVAKQKKSGKQTARERVALLLDGGSFVETAMLAADTGVVTGMGTVDGRPVAVFAQDFTVVSGAVGAAQAAKVVRLLKQAQKIGVPVVGIADSNGAKIGEGAAALEAYADVAANMARLSGVVPMITVVAGPCIGAAAMVAELSDFVIVAGPEGAVLEAGPQVLNSAAGKSYTTQALGGGETVVAAGGAHFACKDEAAAIEQAKALLAMLPSNNIEDAPFTQGDDMNRLVEGVEAGAAPMKVIEAVADAGSIIEIGKGYTDAVTALAKMAGRTVMFVGTGSGDTCLRRMRKIARMVAFADCYNIPVISLIDSTGMKLADSTVGQMNTVKAASALVYTYSEATTVKLALVTGKAIGAMYVAMGGSANADAVYAIPGSVISPVSGEAAVQIAQQDKLAQEGATLESLAAEYEAQVADGVNAAKAGLVDDVIDPAETRKVLIAALELFSGKRDSNPAKKHGNMPL